MHKTLSTKNCFFCNLRCCNKKRSKQTCYVKKMSRSTSASDETKPAASAAVVTTAAGSQVPSAFSIDGLLGLKQQEAADKTVKEESGGSANSKQLDTAASTSSVATAAHPQAGQPSATAQASAAGTHLVYSAAAAASTMLPSPALHGTLWSGHPAASIAAFRCKYMHVQHACYHRYVYLSMQSRRKQHAIKKNQHLLHFSLYLSS